MNAQKFILMFKIIIYLFLWNSLHSNLLSAHCYHSLLPCSLGYCSDHEFNEVKVVRIEDMVVPFSISFLATASMPEDSTGS